MKTKRDKGLNGDKFTSKKKKSTEKDYIEKNYFKFKTRQGALWPL